MCMQKRATNEANGGGRATACTWKDERDLGGGRIEKMMSETRIKRTSLHRAAAREDREVT